MTYYEIQKTEIPPEPQVDRRLKPNSARKLAEQQGLIRYQGEACGQGHSGIRCTKGGQCVDCVAVARGSALNPRQRSNKNHALALKAAAAGDTTYIPEKPCKLGHNLRFVNSNNCIECDVLMREKHKITQKFNRILKLYGLNKEQYLFMVANQNSSCKLCGHYEKDHFQLHIDHCHSTGKVRSLLCMECNQGIGLFEHSPERLRQAALYCEVV